MTPCRRRCHLPSIMYSETRPLLGDDDRPSWRAGLPSSGIREYGKLVVSFLIAALVFYLLLCHVIGMGRPSSPPSVNSDPAATGPSSSTTTVNGSSSPSPTVVLVG